MLNALYNAKINIKSCDQTEFKNIIPGTPHAYIKILKCLKNVKKVTLHII